MEQRLERVTTTDGTTVAYASIGAGRPVLYVSGWLSHLERGWELVDERRFLEGLATGVTLVRYDRAGCGLSPATSRAPSLAYELEQLDAVASTLGGEPFDLVGTSLGACVAVAWAATHPGSVRRLVLYGGWAHGPSISPPEVRESILSIVQSHWGLGSEVLTDIFAPDASPATRATIGRYQRDSSTAETARSLLALSYELDVRGLLDAVRSPTLVLQREGDRAAPLTQAEELAAGIAGAKLEVLPGRSHLPYIGDADSVVAAIRRFLGLRALASRKPALTTRQLAVAQLVSAGLTNRQIAARLGIEERSAEGHVERIRLRLGFASRAQIASWFAARKDE